MAAGAATGRIVKMMARVVPTDKARTVEIAIEYVNGMRRSCPRQQTRRGSRKMAVDGGHWRRKAI
jgi:hypothetical protein